MSTDLILVNANKKYFRAQKIDINLDNFMAKGYKRRTGIDYT